MSGFDRQLDLLLGETRSEDTLLIRVLKLWPGHAYEKNTCDFLLLKNILYLCEMSIMRNILKATLMAEWTTEKEFDRPSTAQENGTVNAQANNTELTDRQRKIYELIKNGTVSGTVNAQNMSAVLGTSLRTTKRDLYVLRDMNLIQYVGSDKTGHWEIVKK